MGYLFQHYIPIAVNFLGCSFNLIFLKFNITSCGKNSSLTQIFFSSCKVFVIGQPFISLEAEINDLIDKEDFSYKLSKDK